jgi:hypothetical protein
MLSLQGVHVLHEAIRRNRSVLQCDVQHDGWLIEGRRERVEASASWSDEQLEPSETLVQRTRSLIVDVRGNYPDRRVLTCLDGISAAETASRSAPFDTHPTKRDPRRIPTGTTHVKGRSQKRVDSDPMEPRLRGDMLRAESDIDEMDTTRNTAGTGIGSLLDERIRATESHVQTLSKRHAYEERHLPRPRSAFPEHCGSANILDAVANRALEFSSRSSARIRRDSPLAKHSSSPSPNSGPAHGSADTSMRRSVAARIVADAAMHRARAGNAKLHQEAQSHSATHERCNVRPRSASAAQRMRSTVDTALRFKFPTARTFTALRAVRKPRGVLF